jgi:hypothetical protein
MKTILENWSMYLHGSVYDAPEVLSHVLVGTVYGHPRKEDGKWIRTSSIVALDLVAGTCRTRNTLYELGEPDERYLGWLREKGYGMIDEFLERRKKDAQAPSG